VPLARACVCNVAARGGVSDAVIVADVGVLRPGMRAVRRAMRGMTTEERDAGIAMAEAVEQAAMESPRRPPLEWLSGCSSRERKCSATERPPNRPAAVEPQADGTHALFLSQTTQTPGLAFGQRFERP
jgi:hypothetical protein